MALGSIILNSPQSTPGRRQALQRESATLECLMVYLGDMRKIFVSHASADKDFVDAFVDRILILGCGLKAQDIFYSSRVSTGVASGQDLLSTVRQAVKDAELVVAIISPTYLTRPVCVAEMGAAWANVGKLFPVLTPGLSRDDLEGILTSQLIRSCDDSDLLDELYDTIGEVVGQRRYVSNWSTHKLQWQDLAQEKTSLLGVPDRLTASQARKLRGEKEDAMAAWRSSLEEIASLEEKIRLLTEAKTREEAVAALVPRNEAAIFKTILTRLETSYRALDRLTANVIRYDVILNDEMRWPSDDDYTASRLANEAVSNSTLVLDEEQNTLSPRYDIPAQEQLKESIEALALFFQESSSDFSTWFVKEYGYPCDLALQPLWDVLTRR